MENESIYFEVAESYAQQIVSGEVLACPDLQLVCQRFLNDLESSSWDFKTEQFDFVINLIQGTIKHQQGESKDGTPLAQKPFRLLPWQVFVVVNLLGFFLKDTNIRRFNESLIFVPRKQGKTAFMASLAWALGVLDRRSGSKAYILANSVKQTMESFSFLAKNLSKQAKRNRIRIRDNNQEHSISMDWAEKGSVFVQALAASPDRLDSLNCNILILDEIHSWKRAGAKRYQLMKNAQKVYRNRLLLGISTAGDISNGFLDNRIQTLVKVLDGTIQDTSFDRYFVFICRAAQDKSGNILGADNKPTTLDDPYVLQMVNPSVGETVLLNELMDEAAQAMNEPQLKTEFLNKTLNIFTNSSDAYFDTFEFKTSDSEYNWTEEELLDFNLTWYGGADLSRLHDLTAGALYATYETEGKSIDIVISHAFFPKVEMIKKAEQDDIPLGEWQEENWLTLSDTPTVHYEDIVNWFVAMKAKGFKIIQIGQDKRYARDFQSMMKSKHFKVVDQPQNYWIKNEGFRRIEMKAKNREFYYLHNRAYEYCLSNVKAIEKLDDMVQYEKINETRRIDMFDASVFACCRMLEMQEKSHKLDRALHKRS